MSGIFMRIDGIDSFKGMASVEEIAGKKGFFPISSFSMGYSRSIYVAVGSAGDAESGIPAIGDVSIMREPDAASAILETLFFAPGDKGKTIEIVETKTNPGGDGMIPRRVVTLEEARLSSYGTDPSACTMTLAFTTISVTHYFQTDAGGVEKGDVVKFDLKTGKLVSGNQAAKK
ncbi:type VI secretion system tube protein Hcp [Sulfitobacter sp. CW3]|jgi:type VI secretion system secreted protein Hcp|uniref:type VI secretion system tube protein Hcp n=1 Tax=Sulfitobacter sp. CW3 TaxID=2861965 RepID=UPI001C601786|nr:type VI secretion system tube protein Hcp [Sulfitobacter sp. CW3]MBW4964199.1 type VI secretion system tube protein Hcp [Sulfitobacter sp. CW3]